MREAKIRDLIDAGLLRRRSVDTPRINSLIESARNNASVAKEIPLTERTATIVFRELYEALRQVGDAKWWSLGYDSRGHEPSMDILSEEDIPNKLKLHKLDRFRQIRNDANYRGYKIPLDDAEEILGVWDSCGEDLIHNILKSVQPQYKHSTSTKKIEK